MNESTQDIPETHSFVNPTPKQIARFWKKVNKTDTCWLWIGGNNPGGYGNFSFLDRTYSAHRVAWIITNGAIPLGLCVCHSCDIRNCVNPSHLWLGTGAESMGDMAKKGRAASGDNNGSRLHPERLRRGDNHPLRINPPKYNGNHWTQLHPERLQRGDNHILRKHPEFVLRGSKNARSKFSEEDAKYIFNSVQSKTETIRSLSAKYKVSFQCIYGILKKKTWRHIHL